MQWDGERGCQERAQRLRTRRAERWPRRFCRDYPHPGNPPGGRRAGTTRGVGHEGWTRCIDCIRAAASTTSASPAWNWSAGLVAEAAQDVAGAAAELASGPTARPG